MGITGYDQVIEANTDVVKLMDLGFGDCRLQVQVKRGVYKEPRELIGKRIATSFPHTVERYFQKLEGTDAITTKIKVLSGSVEASCALGFSDGVVDLVESGETMRAAGLEAIDTVLSTGAVLIRSPNPRVESLIPTIVARIHGIVVAKRFVLCNYNIHRDNLATAIKITPGRRAPTVSSLEESGWVAVSAMLEKRGMGEVLDRLEATGAQDIIISSLTNFREGAVSQ